MQRDSSTWSPLEIAGFVALIGQFIASIALLSDAPSLDVRLPVIQATVAGFLSTVFLVWNRLAGRRGSRAARLVVTLFLGGMPVVYVSQWFLQQQPGWLGIELGGTVLFVVLAVLGWRGSVWFLVGGILLHGVLWDLTHHGQQAFVPGWYTLGCFVADVGMSIYLAIEAPWFDASAQRVTSQRAAV